MKRITFIAPVESVRGNMSGKQNLVYADNDNKAYDAPNGDQYARNYKPRYVGSRRAKDGMTYFAVKTKTATKIDAASKTRMAAMGGTCACYGDTGWVWPLATLSILQQNFLAAKESDPTLTMRKYAFKAIYATLKRKNSAVSIVGPNGVAKAGNPFVKNAVNPLGITDAAFQKFFPVLNVGGVTFEVEGVGQGIGWSQNEFAEIISEQRMNILNLTTEEIDGSIYVKYGDSFLRNASDDYVESSDVVTDGATYTLDEERPV